MVPESCVFGSGDSGTPYLGKTGRARFAVTIQVGPEPCFSCFHCSSTHWGKHRLKCRIGFSGVRPEAVYDRLKQSTSTGMSSQFGTHTGREPVSSNRCSDRCHCSPPGETLIPQRTLSWPPGSMASPQVPAASCVKSSQDPTNQKEACNVVGPANLSKVRHCCQM